MLTVAQTTLSMKGLHPSRRSVLGAAAALAAGARPRPGTAAVTSAAAEGGSVDGLNVDPSATLVDTSQDYDISRAVLYDTASGSFLPAAPERSLKPALRRAADGAGEDIRVLFAGEEPTHPLHHRMQLEMVKAVDAMDDRPVAIGLEMFYRAHQPALDAFVFDDGSFAALKRRTKWRSTWGYDFNHYSKILAYARQHGIRLVGLNVPFGFVSAVANNGLDGLPASLKPYMPTIDRGNERHFARFERDVRLVPGGPAVDGTTLAHWYEAELLWEEYMAQSIAGYVQHRVQQHEGRIVVLAGASRVRAKDGVPDRVTRRTGGATFTVLPLTVPWATTGMPAITQPLGASEADWLLYTQAEISHEPRRISPFGPRVLQESPRVSPVALRLGTSSAPLTEA